MTVRNATYKAFLATFAERLREQILELKTQTTRPPEPDTFREGRQLGYFEVISTFKNTLFSFQIPASHAGLEDFDPDNDVF